MIATKKKLTTSAKCCGLVQSSIEHNRPCTFAVLGNPMNSCISAWHSQGKKRRSCRRLAQRLIQCSSQASLHILRLDTNSCDVQMQQGQTMPLTTSLLILILDTSLNSTDFEVCLESHRHLHGSCPQDDQTLSERAPPCSPCLPG